VTRGCICRSFCRESVTGTTRHGVCLLCQIAVPSALSSVFYLLCSHKHICGQFSVVVTHKAEAPARHTGTPRDRDTPGECSAPPGYQTQRIKTVKTREENMAESFEFAAIRKWQCASKGCDHETTDWYREGWLCTGFSRTGLLIENQDVRWDLEQAGLIRKTDLVVALICPEHEPKMHEALGGHIANAMLANCPICWRNDRLRRNDGYVFSDFDPYGIDSLIVVGKHPLGS
jgi:hypothetical protein